MHQNHKKLRWLITWAILSYFTVVPKHASWILRFTRVIGWYHWNPQNRPKNALFMGDKKSRKNLFKSVKILNWPRRAQFWAHRHLSYHFGNLWTCTQRWLKGIGQKWSEVLLFGHSLKTFFVPVTFYSRPLAFFMKSHYFKELLWIIEKKLWNGTQKWVFGDFFWK